jgi:hypothetical protein
MLSYGLGFIIEFCNGRVVRELFLTAFTKSCSLEGR